ARGRAKLNIEAKGKRHRAQGKKTIEQWRITASFPSCIPMGGSHLVHARVHVSRTWPLIQDLATRHRAAVCSSVYRPILDLL
ncbi:MAG: hypothetical protein WBF55_18975, partial [Syntrophobacteria bacterium]